MVHPLHTQSGTTRGLGSISDGSSVHMHRNLIEQGELTSQATVLLNGRNAYSRGGMAAKLGDDTQDRVAIVVLGPAVAGG